MDKGLLHLLTAMAGGRFRNLDRAVAVLWWVSRSHPGAFVPVGDICAQLEQAGYAKQNRSRLAVQLKKDPRTRSKGADIGLSVKARQGQDAIFAPLLGVTPPEESDSVLPAALLRGSRGYLERIVFQLNASYDATLYDCTAVMARRLVETLIIEVYENKKRAAYVKRDGEYLMLNGLLGCLEEDADIHLGRNAKKGLRDLKTLGDQSAHNRRFLAREADIEKIRSGLRISVEELAHLAGLA